MDIERVGKYRVVGRIGRGAMGEVYKAHDPLLNRFVALKTISPSLAADSEFRRRFQREAQSAAQLNHPNIVTVFDFGEEAGLTYMAMELLEGRDLREALRGRGLGPLGRKLEVMEQICEGLAYAHAHGVVHRDLKPGNIHIQPSGHVKILDFGLARLGHSELTRSGTVMGTPHYMSPEQVRGEKADYRSDVFALGSIFYEILSGRRAFDADATHEVLRLVLERDPEPLRQVSLVTPVAVAEVVEKALAKSPEKRFADAGEVGRALATAQDALAGETLATPAASADDGVERTLLAAAGATVVDGRSGLGGYQAVAGANALDLGGRERPHRRHEATMRPDPTLLAEATQVPRAPRWLLGGAALLVVGAAAGGVLWVRGRAVAPAATQGVPPTRGDGALPEALVLSELFVAGKVELARADLAGHDYASAAARAREALARDESNPEAREVLGRAESALRELAAAAAEARQAVARADTAAATAALDRVLALDPRNPLAAELSSELNRHYRGRAEEARRQAEEARSGAEALRASTQPGYLQGRKTAAEAGALFREEQFAVSAQRFLAARSAFEGARRAAQAQAASPPPVPVRTPPPAPPQVAAAPSRAEALPPAASSILVQPTPALPPPTSSPAIPSPSPSATVPVPATSAANPVPAANVPAAPTPDTRLEQLTRVIDQYKRAIESREVALVRAVKPNLTAAEEKGLSDVFKTVRSYHVEMSIDPASVRLEGDRATLRASRVDTVDGRPLKPLRQTFSLERQGGGWRIVAYAFER